LVLLWGDGGLKDLLVDSSVYAAGTVDQMLNGKEFNRATRAFVFSLVLGFGGNVTASSDKSDQKLSLHQLKKADDHDTLNASYANTKALVARLNSLPFSILSLQR
jgi:hypothetical protein